MTKRKANTQASGLQWPADAVERRPIESLIPSARNSRTHSDEQVAQIAASMQEWGWTNPVLVDESDTIIAGHGRILAARKLGHSEAPVMVARGWTDTQKRAYMIADNKLALNAGWDDALLKLELVELGEEGFELPLIGFSADELAAMLSEGEEGAGGESSGAGSLSERFGVPPFSVLNAREGWWQERKRAWLGLGIRSEIGRDAAVGGSKMVSGYGEGGRETGLVTESDTSIFDPVLCELAYRWFSPPGGLILDPFAGGSVRGIVASHLGREYIGCELREAQVEANREQESIAADPLPVWQCIDARRIDEACGDVEADLIFTCPPYADLEVYSDDPDDLSTLDYASFRAAYFEIIRKACEQLKADRFACIVVGEVRDKRGNYYNFVGDTVEAFRAAGMSYYNEAILVTAVGSLPIRAGRQFSAGRKLGKTHQNVLVFAKGDGKRAAQACGECDFGDVEAFAAEAAAADGEDPAGRYGEVL